MLGFSVQYRDPGESGCNTSTCLEMGVKSMAIDVPKPDFASQEDWDYLMSVRNPDNIKSNAKADIDRIRREGWPEDLATMGGAALLLTVAGRKSGLPRTTPVNYARYNDNVYVVGSIAGLDKHPVWALNLESALKGKVEMPGEEWDFEARKLEGEEREDIWPKLDAQFPFWGHFQKYCEREFMVFLLTPARS
jgi:F420H(2)-dependent quinone reductase